MRRVRTRCEQGTVSIALLLSLHVSDARMGEDEGGRERPRSLGELR